jgi:hypothetical protein
MKIDWSALLFWVWQLLNSAEGAKRALDLFYLAPLVAAVGMLLKMPKAPAREPNTKHTESIERGRQRKRVKRLGSSVIVANVVVLGMYLWVRSLLPKDASSFPSDHVAALWWLACLIVTILTLVLLIIFIRLYYNLNPKS